MIILIILTQRVQEGIYQILRPQSNHIESTLRPKYVIWENMDPLGYSCYYHTASSSYADSRGQLELRDDAAVNLLPAGGPCSIGTSITSNVVIPYLGYVRLSPSYRNTIRVTWLESHIPQVYLNKICTGSSLGLEARVSLAF